MQNADEISAAQILGRERSASIDGRRCAYLGLHDRWSLGHAASRNLSATRDRVKWFTSLAGLLGVFCFPGVKLPAILFRTSFAFIAWCPMQKSLCVLQLTALRLLTTAAIGLAACSVRGGETALDRYVAKPDPTYSWKIVRT